MSDSLQQPTRLPRPWDSPGKNTGVGCHFFLQCMKVKSESEVAQSCLTLSDPWTGAHQAPPSMGFSRQEYWSGVPLPSLVRLCYLSQFPITFIKYTFTCHFCHLRTAKVKKKKKKVSHKSISKKGQNTLEFL